jgi:hypothetical protein
MNKNEIIQYAIIAIIIIAMIVFLEDSELKDILIDIFNDSLAQMNVDRERRRFRRMFDD